MVPVRENLNADCWNELRNQDGNGFIFRHEVCIDCTFKKMFSIPKEFVNRMMKELVKSRTHIWAFYSSSDGSEGG